MPRRELLEIIVYEELNRDPDFDIYSIVDREEAIEILNGIIEWLKSEDSQRVIYRAK